MPLLPRMQISIPFCYCQIRLTRANHNYTFSPSYKKSNNTNKRNHIHMSAITHDDVNNNNSQKKRLPVLLFDIMDTVVRDPFYHDVPLFFRMPFKELIDHKHPTAWIEFETGLIDEMELTKKFFKDGRSFDLDGLKNCMREGYSYIDGIEELLYDLKRSNYQMHACTNYPVWYELIEDKLNVSSYLSWTFCSCFIGKRKPDPDFFWEVLRHLQVDPAGCIFIDDRLRNVEAAIDVGISALHFKNTESLRQDLSRLGINVVPRKL